MWASAIRKSCAVGDGRRWVCIDVRTSDRRLSISGELSAIAAVMEHAQTTHILPCAL